MADYDTAWSFETDNLAVELRIHPCLEDPADMFTDEADIQAIRSDQVAYFDAEVAVIDKNTRIVIGRDTLAGCAYRDVAEFYTSHRDRDPMNRNSSLMRASRGENVSICHYFPEMVLLAVRDARNNINRLCKAVGHE